MTDVVSSPSRPDQVYKYLPPERLTYLTDHLLRFTQPLDLNDPFESRMGFLRSGYANLVEVIAQKSIATLRCTGSERAREVERIRFKASWDLSRFLHHQARMVEDDLKKISKVAGILSLSERWDSSLMCAHYSSQHMGFCLGFNLAHPFFANDGAKTFEAVNYSESLFMVDPSKAGAVSYRSSFHKSKDWQYEQEWRMAILFDEKKPVKICENTNGNWPIKLYSVPHGAVSEVIMGLRANEELKAKLVTFARCHKIPAFRTELARESFGLERVPVT